MTAVRTGLENFIARPPDIAIGTCLGLLTNPSGVDRQLRSSVNQLSGHAAFTLAAMYGPEHGVRGEAQAGEAVAGDIDPRSGLPVFSLYGEHRIPSAEMLEGVDTIVIDLQDIGVRFTTYISTVAHMIDACAGLGKHVVILDRPNPLTGSRVGGNRLEMVYGSFVGIHAIPILHGLTIGEFGRLWARDHGLPMPTVVAMEGWRRDMWFDDTGLPWVPPSPNLPTLDSIVIFPGTCLIEGTNLSEGRGTTRPFETIGAPWIDPEALVEALTALNLAGVAYRPVYFTPVFSKHAGFRCGGVQIYVNDRESFDAVAFGPWLLHTVRRLDPEHFAWLPPDEGAFFIDKLAGGAGLREAVDSGTPVEDLLDRWSQDARAFTAERSDILLY